MSKRAREAVEDNPDMQFQGVSDVSSQDLRKDAFLLSKYLPSWFRLGWDDPVVVRVGNGR